VRRPYGPASTTPLAMRTPAARAPGTEAPGIGVRYQKADDAVLDRPVRSPLARRAVAGTAHPEVSPPPSAAMCLTGSTPPQYSTIGTTRRPRGYTRTQHAAGYLSPGGLCRPDPTAKPHVVTAASRHHGHITLADQYGRTYPYPANGLILTALPDPLINPSRPAPHR